MKYRAKSKTGMIKEFNDKREFNYGFFSTLLEDCNKCNGDNSNICKKGRTVFEGVSKGRKKSFHICSEARYKKEIVDLEIIN